MVPWPRWPSTGVPDNDDRSGHHSTIQPYGIKLLHCDDRSSVDIVFIHGLNGHRESTWKLPAAEAPWPKLLLPEKIPNARILTFGYDARVTDWQGMVSKNRIGNHSMNLLSSLANYREWDDTNDHPIIFVCHSLGGLVCQDALCMAQCSPERHLKQIFNSTNGIAFLGTPHSGSGLAHWAESLAKTLSLVKQTNSEIIRTLQSDSEVLSRVQTSFHMMIRSRAQQGLLPIEITCFYEERPLPGIGIVVPSHSAILPGYTPRGIQKNHMDMTKFGSDLDSGFIAVVGELRRWVRQITRHASESIQEPELDSHAPTGYIQQSGSEFRGPITVSGGILFQGNYIGRTRSGF